MPGPDNYGEGPGSRIYIKGKMYDARDFDQDWIKAHCPVNHPSQLPS